MTRTILMSSAAALMILAACGTDTSANATPAPQETEAETAAAPAADTPALPDSLSDVASGAYSLDRNHAFLEFSVGHSGGISDYIVHFGDFDADLEGFVGRTAIFHVQGDAVSRAHCSLVLEWDAVENGPGHSSMKAFSGNSGCPPMGRSMRLRRTADS